MGLDREWLNSAGLPQGVTDTIQNARASLTRMLFEKWCLEVREVPFQCSVADISLFTGLGGEGESISTVKVYLATISACHISVEGKTVGQHPLVYRFMRGARHKLPVSRPLVPSWDLPTGLEALFGPMEQADLKFMTLKLLYCCPWLLRSG